MKYVTTSRLLPFILGGLVFAWVGVGMHEHLAWRSSVTLWTRVVECAQRLLWLDRQLAAGHQR